MDPDLVSPSLVDEKWPEDALAAPTGLRPRGAGGAEPLLLDGRCDSSAFVGYAVPLSCQEALESPLARRTVSIVHVPLEPKEHCARG